ncbi:hypothetical protein D9M70_540530 [compost metagenome]
MKRNSGASGPKVSSLATAALLGTSTRMVGSKKLPPRACGLPPATTLAPLLTASAMCSSTFFTAFSSISGPVVVPSSRPLPICSLATAALSFSTKASYTPSCTYRRLAHTQVWPLLRYLEISAPSTALSRSASSKTMNGALPPNSRDTFLMSLAHSAISWRPISVEPVKVSLRTIGLLVSSPPTSPALPVTTLNTPAGMPARSASSASARAE